MRRVVSLVLLAVAMVLLAGCRTDAFLEVQVDEDGGGAVYVAVALDQEAANRSVLYETRASHLLPIDDLARAGWRVTGPAQEQDGRVWIRAEKEFSQLDQLTGVVNEVAGPDGPFRNFTVERSSSFGEKGWQFTGTVDLTKGLAGFSDDGVAAAFGGQPLGQPADSFAKQLGAPLEQAVTVNVIVNLPGELGEHNGVVGSAGQAVGTTVAAPGATGTGDPSATTVNPVRTPDKGAAVVWNPSFADSGPTNLAAASSSRQLLPRVWRWVGLTAGVVGVVVLAYRLGQLLMDRRRDQRRGVGAFSGASTGRATDEGRPFPLGPSEEAPPGAFPTEPALSVAPLEPVSGSGLSPAVRVRPVDEPPAPAVVGAASSGAASPGGGVGPEGVPGRRGGLGLIVIESTGALLAPRDPVDDVLVPFCRQRGCVLSVRQIADLYRARVTGAASADEFWAGLGLSGDPVLLDDAFAGRFELSDHVVSFLAQARRRGVAVVVVGDEAREWISVYRQRFKLDGLVGSWVASAELGVRVPHPALLEAVQRLSGIEPSRAMVIATHRPLLDTAARLGYRTVQYQPDRDDAESEHPVLRTFAERGRPSPSTTR